MDTGFPHNFNCVTYLLIISYKPEEKFKAQGLNDFLVISTQASGALTAGYLLYLTNWQFTL